MAIIHPVVLSGGAGTRLWPLSRALYPKQFIRFSDTQSDTFLAAALKRLAPARGFAEPVIVCNNDHRFLVRAGLLGRGPVVPFRDPDNAVDFAKGYNVNAIVLRVPIQLLQQGAPGITTFDVWESISVLQ